jgi:hypothetical protein
MARIKIIGLTNGDPTPFDNTYLVEYDPMRPGVSPEGEPMLAHMVTTRDPEQATVFSPAEALALWQLSNGVRPDGKPNRPLTAFNVEISY